MRFPHFSDWISLLEAMEKHGPAALRGRIAPWTASYTYSLRIFGNHTVHFQGNLRGEALVMRQRKDEKGDRKMKAADCSFAHFVYPFLFDPVTFKDRNQAVLGAGKQGRKMLIPAWQLLEPPKHDLLPHVEHYLNVRQEGAETGRPTEIDPKATAYLWGLGTDRDNPYRLVTQDAWRVNVPDRREKVTPADKGRDRLRPLDFHFGNAGVPAAQLALFRIGVGLLTVYVRLESASTEDWLDFLHHFRYVSRRDEASLTIPEQVGSQICAVTEGKTLPPTLNAILYQLMGTGSLPGEPPPSTDDKKTRWWEDVFVPGKMLPFAALFVDGDSPTTPVTEEEQAELRYRMHNFFRANKEIIPGEADLCGDHLSRLPYAARQWFLFSIEGGSFLACDAPQNEFFRKTLPDHLRRDYFLLFQLALHQRFALMGLSDEVARKWPLDSSEGSDEEREKAFQQIRDRLLAFTARGYFAQVMQSEHHHRCYVKWQEIFQIARLYEEVRDEVREMHEYLRMKQAEQTQRIQEETQRIQKETQREQEKAQSIQEAQTGVITWFVAALTLTCAVFGFLGINVKGLNVPSLSLGHALLVLGAVIGVAALFLIPPLRHHRAVSRRVQPPSKASNKDKSK